MPVKKKVDEVVSEDDGKITEDDFKKLSSKVDALVKTSKITTFDLKDLMSQISERPDLAIELVKVLGRITRPWEDLGTNLSQTNEVPVPSTLSAKEFLKDAKAQAYVSGWRLSTIFGEEVALVIKDNPKYKIVILGEVQSDAPFVQHAQKVEQIVKDFVAEKLKARGFILG